jgi:uncharacterized protein
MKNIVLTLLIFALFTVSVSAESGHMKLLAVSDTENGQVGGIADLYLEVEPGSGRVFLETFPLTRVDTQISTRFAKEIACDFADIDCTRYDFFYTITADSSIIAGPSAGAAISILTFSLISDVKLDDEVAITGTINSGGLVGPVGGLRAKVEAADRAGIKKVLIPIGESISQNQSSLNVSTNSTFDLEELRKNHDLDIIEVTTLDEALFEFTGKKFREQKSSLAISPEYTDTMKILAVEMCSRSTKLKKEISNIKIQNATQRIKDNAVNLSEKGKRSFDDNMYYSAASYCFGANVEFNYLSFLDQNLSEKDIIGNVNLLKKEILEFDEKIKNEKIMTITDLESYMVVKERLIEADDFLDLVLETSDNRELRLRNLAYARERINSAYSWSQFLKNTGKEFNLEKSLVREACRTKISEVEERFQYMQLYYPQNLEGSRKQLDYAYQDLQNGNYELCLFKASKAKASVDTVIGVFGVRTDNVDNIIDKKLEIVERNLVEETEKGVFPILGYSYFEYANSLKGSDPFSALLYSGYALELSNLDIYFKSSQAASVASGLQGKEWGTIAIFVLGIFTGIVIMQFIKSKKPGAKKSKRKPRQNSRSSEILPGKKR